MHYGYSVRNLFFGLVSVTIKTLQLRSKGRGFDFRSNSYQVVTIWTDDGIEPTPMSTQPSIPPGQVNRAPVFFDWG